MGAIIPGKMGLLTIGMITASLGNSATIPASEFAFAFLSLGAIFLFPYFFSGYLSLVDQDFLSRIHQN